MRQLRRHPHQRRLGRQERGAGHPGEDGRDHHDARRAVRGRGDLRVGSRRGQIPGGCQRAAAVERDPHPGSQREAHDVIRADP